MKSSRWINMFCIWLEERRKQAVMTFDLRLGQHIDWHQLVPFISSKCSSNIVSGSSWQFFSFTVSDIDSSSLSFSSEIRFSNVRRRSNHSMLFVFGLWQCDTLECDSSAHQGWRRLVYGEEMSRILSRDLRINGTFRKRRSSLDLPEINNDWSIEAHHHSVKPLPMNRFPSFVVTRISAMLKVALSLNKEEEEEIPFSEQIFVRVNRNDSLFLCVSVITSPFRKRRKHRSEQNKSVHVTGLAKKEGERENWYD